MALFTENQPLFQAKHFNPQDVHLKGHFTKKAQK